MKNVNLYSTFNSPVKLYEKLETKTRASSNLLEKPGGQETTGKKTEKLYETTKQRDSKGTRAKPGKAKTTKPKDKPKQKLKFLNSPKSKTLKLFKLGKLGKLLAD